MSNILGALVPDWPEWSVNLLTIMFILLPFSLGLSHTVSSSSSDEEREKVSTGEGGNTKKSVKDLEKDFLAFQKQYLVVYMIIMLADWMQGTHMYTLYLSYGVNISALFLTGFLSGAIFAPFLGSLVDRYGRKKSCIAYCVLEVIINALEHSTHFPTLLFGRVLGGISTNLLFSAFESWMTTEHHKRGFPQAWLSRTFSGASILNGTMAVLAGIVAQLLEDNFGQIGPFQGAIALTVLALLFVLGWEENYGEAENNENSTTLYVQFLEGWKATASDSRIWRTGLTQALSEGAMYTFVFMWVPTLLSMNPPGGLPTGCVFSSFMIAITIGGALYPPLEKFIAKFVLSEANSSEMSATIIYVVASFSMAIPSYYLSSSAPSVSYFGKIVFSFVLVEVCVGSFMPVAGTIRSKYVPDSLSGAVLNIFRLPLNAVVVAGTYATDIFEPSQVFMMVSVCFLAAALLQATLINTKVTESESKKKD